MKRDHRISTLVTLLPKLILVRLIQLTYCFIYMTGSGKSRMLVKILVLYIFYYN